MAGAVENLKSLIGHRGRRLNIKGHMPTGLVLRRKSESTVYVALIYALLVGIACTFLIPLLYMISMSLQGATDYYDPSVNWVPTRLELRNFKIAWDAMQYPLVFKNSIIIVAFSALGQVLSAAMIGYGFARLKFRGREALFMLVLFTFIVPPQTIIVPLFMLYRKLGFIDTFRPFIVPAFFGQGLRGSLFILIFRQFFKGQPWELENAALVDGCGEFGTFYRIMLPLAKPAILVTFLFSVVWHWNDYYEPSIYIIDRLKQTVPVRITSFYSQIDPMTGNAIGEVILQPIEMAASLLVVLPPLLLYIVAQRYFVESIERTGLVD